MWKLRYDCPIRFCRDSKTVTRWYGMQSPGPLIVPIDNAGMKKATFYCCSMEVAYKTPPEGQATIIGKMLGSTPPPQLLSGLYSSGFTWVLLLLFLLPDCLVCSPQSLSKPRAEYVLLFAVKRGQSTHKPRIFFMFVLSTSFSFCKSQVMAIFLSFGLHGIPF